VDGDLSLGGRRGGMKTKSVIVNSPSFETDVFATLMLCDCESSRFIIYLINGTDLHLECVECGVSYCQSEKCRAYD
jgi:hypothetical protein